MNPDERGRFLEEPPEGAPDIDKAHEVNYHLDAINTTRNHMRTRFCVSLRCVFIVQCVFTPGKHHIGYYNAWRTQLAVNACDVVCVDLSMQPFLPGCLPDFQIQMAASRPCFLVALMFCCIQLNLKQLQRELH